MFARFDENPAMTLKDIKETKRYGRTHGRTDNVKTVYPPQTKFAGGITKVLKTNGSLMKVESIVERSLGAFCNTFDLHLAIIRGMIQKF